MSMITVLLERTFSLLTQVVGRAGRGERLGRAIIQTFTPQNDVIQCAAEQDYDRFYANEIRMREARGMPPYRELYVFTVSGTDEGAVLEAACGWPTACGRGRRSRSFKTPHSRSSGPLPHRC